MRSTPYISKQAGYWHSCGNVLIVHARGMAFKTEPERLWFRGRFSMLQDILKESWVYQEMKDEFFEQFFGQGIERGREQERREELLRQRQALLVVTQKRFPKLVRLIKKEAESI